MDPADAQRLIDTLPAKPADGAKATVREIAALIGEDASSIKILETNWQQYLENGTHVKLSLGRWRGRSPLKLEDLGIQPDTDDERKRIERMLVLGSRYVLPRAIMKEAEAIESKARYALEKRSFRTFWGRWIHTSKYEEWREVNDRLKADYLALAQRIEDTWDDLLEQSQADYAVLGMEVYNRLVARGALNISRTPMSTWVQGFVARSLAQAQNVGSVKASFTYEWESTYVATAAQVAQDQAEAGRIRLSRAEGLMLEDVRRTAAAKAAEGCQRLANDLIAEVRAQVYDAAVDALEGIRKNDGRLPRNNSRQLSNLIQMVGSMVFWSDPSLQTRIAAVQRVVETPSNRRSMDEVRDVLVALGSEARLVLTSLERTPKRSAKQVGISDDLGELKVGARRRAGSQSLNLGTVELRPGARRKGGGRATLAS